MKTRAEVLVLGAGAAGIAAARGAVRAGAERVVLVNAGAGATELSSGWLRGVEEAPAWVSDVGLARAQGARAFAYATVAGLVQSARGGVSSLLDLGELDGREGALAVVDLVAGPAWSAAMVARSLGELLGVTTKVLRPEPADAVPRGATPSSLARVFDTPGMVDALASSLRAQVRAGEVSAVLFPPVLGLAREDVASRLRALLGVPVGEVGGGVGDPPAFKLARALGRGVPEGVERVRGRGVVSLGDDGVRAEVRVGERVFEPDAVVLATGGLVGGGIEFATGFRETAVDAPVFIGSPKSVRAGAKLPALRSADRGMDPLPLFSPDTAGVSSAASAGVRVDAHDRVIGPDGQSALHKWLFAAGAVVWGAQAYEDPGLCDVLRAGERAGARAAEYVKG